MIQIKISEPKVKEAEYTDKMLVPLLERINLLKISLMHISGLSAEISGNGIKSYSKFTARILGLAEGKKYGSSEDFNAASYLATLKVYLSGPNKSADLKIPVLLGFISDLQKEDNRLLKQLLSCRAEDLSSMNADLIQRYTLDSKQLKILKCAITYGHKKLSGVCKAFFRKHNFVSFCPYCNLERALYIPEIEYDEEEQAMGEVLDESDDEEEDSDDTEIGTASVHQLDHFFSQTDFPLLSLSMYNLVPSCATCNALNKGQIEFSDIYHRNPYIRGFDQDARFVPVKDGLKVSRIKLEVFCESDTAQYRQLLGEKDDKSKKRLERGNINVFKLRGKYGIYQKKADFVLNAVNKRVTGLKSYARFKIPWGQIKKETVYKNWYEYEIRTPFEIESFNDEPLSKFNRDIHDHYFEDKNNPNYKFIKGMIKY